MEPLFQPESDPAAREAALIARLRGIRDPQARFAWVVDQARHRPLLPDPLRLDAHRVPGCLVRTWLVPGFADGRCRFQFDSDAASLKAVAGLVCDLYDGRPPAEVAAHEPRFLDDLNLGAHLAENRRRTVGRVREMIRDFAVARLTGAPAAPTPA